MDSKALFGISVAFCFMLLAAAVSASQPQQAYSKIFLAPFYTALMTNNNNYNYTVAINPPDGLSSVQSAIISFDIYLNPSVNFTAQVNGKPCSTYFFYVSTTYASAGQARVTFDCSNEINKKGSYVITLRPSGANTGAVTGWLDLTYMNNPIGSFRAYGTEYQIGQNGTLFLKLLDSNELPINSGFCSLTTYYPNKTIKFMDNAPTTFLENGLYYKDFFVPNTEGLYIADASCSYNDNYYRYAPSNDCGYDGAIGGGTSPQPLVFRDIDCTDFHTLGGGTYQNWTFNYTSMGLINLSTISQIDVNWVGQISAASGVLQIYDFNESVWDTLGASLASSGITLSCGNNVYITRMKTSNFTSYIRNNTIETRIYRAGTATMLTDAMEVILHNNGSVVASLRGSSEIHVSSENVTFSANATINMNATQLGILLAAIDSVNDTVISSNASLSYLIGALNASQGSGFAALYSLVLNTSVNETVLMDAINHVGFNLTAYYGNLTSLLVAHNVSMAQLINALNQSQNNNYAALAVLVDSHNLSMTQLMLSINQSNAAYFNDIEGQLGNLSAYMALHNQTIYDLLVAMNGSCEDRKDEVLAYIDLHNMSIALILDSLNSTMYDSFNEIAAALLNMSNSTINISMDMEDLYRRIRNIVFTQTEPTRLESQARIVTAGFFPIAAAQSLYITNSTCLGNTSLRQFYVESVMITDTTGTDYLNVTRHLDTECAFGCDSAMAIPVCKASPLSNALYFFVFIGIMIAAAGLIYTRYYK
jgi:hypothetical protein